jgi:phosphatidylglycerophosphate synthase
MVRKAILINRTRADGSPRSEGQFQRLAGLALLLRAVLAAQRGGIEELVVVGGADPAPLLARDARVGLRWRWLPADAHDELSLLRAARAELTENVLLFFADSIFEPKAAESLRAQSLEAKLLREADRPQANRATAGASPAVGGAGLYLAAPGIGTHAERLPAGPFSLLGARLRELGLADAVDVAGRVWPRTTARAELRAIHRELAHFHLKPSDGIFARFNKLVVAEPLIRLFLRTPATPNFVTGLGLALALASSWAFMQGDYWWSLAGALLAYASAMMDHVDGMVARLKFLESEFGVWFESVVDISSNLAIFSGLAVGLYRESGSLFYLAVGGLFTFGTVASLVALSRQRKLASPDNPTDYPNRIHAKLEEQSHNFFHWFTRKFYFLARRAVLPYGILLLCLLDLHELLLICVTLGANLVWTLTLYNNRLFKGSAAAGAAGLGS